MFQTLKNDFQICEEIGRGRFGTVYRCFSPVTGDSFAVKSIDKNLLIDSIDRECLEKESKILQLLNNHPNILHLYKVYEDSSFQHIVTEYCPNNDLYERVSSGSLPEHEAARVLTQLISAVNYCHKMGIVHRDIKPDNILFDSEDRLKLADFGSAELCCGGGVMMSGVVGTPYYVAPEVLMGKEYNEKVDVWSVGVVLYIMLAGVPPFYGETPKETFEAVLRGNLRFPTRIFRSVSAEAKDLLRKMICKDVSRRFSAEQVLIYIFTNSQRQEERTGKYGTPRVQYLQELVTQFPNASADGTKEKIVANLANFAYDPFNFTFLRQLNVIELFVDCLTEPSEKLVEFGIGGICNACADPANAALVTQNDGIPLVIQCLSSPVRNMVNYAIGALYYLCNASNKRS